MASSTDSVPLKRSLETDSGTSDNDSESQVLVGTKTARTRSTTSRSWLTVTGAFFLGVLATGCVSAVSRRNGLDHEQDALGIGESDLQSAAAGSTALRQDEDTTRHYYITAELVEWDYAPSGEDLIKGVPLEDSPDAVVFVENTETLVGRKYMKSLYKEYTDDTYETPVEQPEWLGNVGPIIRAEVGDTIFVHFKNMLPELPASIHAHGVLYTPEHEGTLWRLNSNLGSSVPPGEVHVYEWFAREDSGPGDSGEASNLWFYHGHVDSVPDMYSGLMGPIIIYERGTLDDDGMPSDVDEEFVILFMVSDENQSHYLDMNAETYGADPEDEDFEESNLMHSMNGYVYGNLLGLEMTEGDTVRWHVAAFGTEVDLHTAHWHGNNVKFDEKNVDTIELLPASFFTASMTPDAVGDWLFHCHVNDHILAGMQAFYTVLSIEEDDYQQHDDGGRRGNGGR